MDFYSSESLDITRKNIICIARLAIKKQVELAVYTSLDEDCPDVQNFIVVLEHIFYHGIRGQLKKHRHPWMLLVSLAHFPSLASVSFVRLLDHLKNNFSKLRAWVKLCLIQRSLCDSLKALTEQDRALRMFYYSGSALRSLEFSSLLNSLMALENIQYNLDLKADSINHSGLSPIDLTPYVSFNLSLETQLIAACDCKNEEDNLNYCPWRIGFNKLQRSQIQFVQQLRYHEELLAQQRTELEQYAKTLQRLKERNIKLETHLLELQIQLTLTHEQYRQDLESRGIKDHNLCAPKLEFSYHTLQSSRKIYPPNKKLPTLAVLADVNKEIPSLLSLEQGVDALSLDCPTNRGACTSSSITGSDLDGSKGSRSVRFDWPEVGQEPTDHSLVSINSHPNSASSYPASAKFTTTNSSFKAKSRSAIEHSMRLRKMQPNSVNKTRLRTQKMQNSQLCVGLQEVPSERFVLSDSSHPCDFQSSFKNLDLMAVTVKPRTHSLFTCYVPTQLTNFNEFTHKVDCLMNSHRISKDEEAKRSDTSNPINASDNLNKSASLHKSASAQSLNADYHDGTILLDSAFLDSLTNSDLMENSSTFTSRERLHSSNKEYYQLTSEEDLQSDTSNDFGGDKATDTACDTESRIT